MADDTQEGVERVGGAALPGPQGNDALWRAVGGTVVRVGGDGTVLAIGGDVTVLGDAGAAEVAAAFVGQPVASLFDAQSGDRVETVIRTLERTDLDVASLGVRVVAGGGAPVEAELRASALRSDGSLAGVLGVLRPRADARPGRDEDGRVEAALGPSQDGTERRRARAQPQENVRALKRLYQIGADRDRSLDRKIRDVLALGRERLDLPVGFLAKIDVADDRFEVVHAAGGDDQVTPGATMPLSDTYCRHAVDSDGPLAVADAPEEGWEDDHAYDVGNLDCYVGSKVEVAGELYGTLCFESETARPGGFSDFERTFVELAAQWVSYELERETHRRRLERYRSYTDDVHDAVEDHLYVVDEAGYLERWNEAVAQVTGYADAEIAEMHGTEFFPEDERAFVASKIAEAFEEGSARMETEIETRDGERIPYEYAASALADPDGEPVLAGIGRDVSERKEREQRLEQYRALTEAANDVIVTVDGESTIRSINPAVEDVFGYEPDDLIGEPLAVLMPDQPVDEHRSSGQEYLDTGEGRLDWDYVELPGLRADGSEVPLAISFGEVEYDGDRYFTGILRDVTDRRERERQLEAQRERLAALNSLHEVVAGIAEAVIEQSTREEIEASVCERLAGSASYAFAWMGEVDSAADRVVPRTAANAGDYLDGLEISIDADAVDGRGPTGRAVRSCEVETTRDVLEDPDYGPWRERAREHGVRSSAAVPVVHQGAVFGVLNVYAERPDAFADEERRMLAGLGEIVGHAIAATERKRVIMGDGVVELEIRIPGGLETFGLPATDGTVVLDRVVPLADGEYVTYGTATGAITELIDSADEAVSHWESVERIGEDGATVSFEVRSTDAPALATVGDYGGAVEEAVIEDGDIYMTVHLPPGADVRSLIDAFEETYSRVEPLARRQIQPSDESTRRATLTLLEDLTDRQRTALETAFYAGFYEWPRESSGEDLAEQLDIAPATFAQHLRAAERKLLESVFEEMPASG